MLNEIIKRIYESGEYAGIYANAEDTSKFMYGRIVAFDGEFFAASLVSPDGAFDGITVQDAESVIRIELDGGYSARMKKLQKKMGRMGGLGGMGGGFPGLGF